MPFNASVAEEEEEAEYTGPLDLVPGAAWLPSFSSTRALAASMLGEDGYTLRATDDTELAFAYNASTGLIDASAIATWAAGHGGDAFLKIWNDHTVNAKSLTQATEATQPQWTPNSIAALPSMFGISSTVETSTGIEFTEADPLTVFIVVKFTDFPAQSMTADFRDGVTNSAGIFLFDSFGEMIIDAGPSNDWYVEQPTATGSYIFEWVVAADGSMTLLINGTEPTMNTDTLIPIPTMTAMLTLQPRAPTFEYIAAKQTFSAPQKTAIRQNLATYYGITLP